MRDGKRVDAVAQTTKQGFLFLLDRTTGEPLFPVEERSFPSSEVPGEVTARTQPIPVLPAPFTRQILTEDMLTGRTPEAHAAAVKDFNTFRSAGQFIPTGLDKETVVFPCFLGGAEWGGPAVDPSSGVIFVNANEAACVIALTENKPVKSTGERTYQNQCSICHGKDRSGSPPTYPSLLEVEKKRSRLEIEAVILQGKGRMPSFPNLTGDHLEALVRFLTNSESSGAAAATESTDVPRQPQDSGAETYENNCASCHGEDREGKLPRFPALVGIDQRVSSQQIQDTIHRGKGEMPAFAEIDGKQLQNLLAYLGVRQNAANADPDEGAIYSSTGDGAPMKYQVTGSRDFLDPDGYSAIMPPWGTLSAIDLNTGKYLWKTPLGEYPELAAKGMTNTGSENYGGPIVTAGGLLFIGATVYDKKFRAFDSSTGKLLWETVLQFAAVATPATYMIDGKQYVVIAAGGGKDPKAPSGSTYITFALP
jgi:glucose dehydrogenase